MRDPGPTYETVEEITCEFSSRGVLRRREIARTVLEHRANWATLAFAYQDMKSGSYDAPRFMLARWRRVAGRWHLDSRINLRPDLELAAHAVLASWDLGALAAAADQADDAA